MVFKGHDDNSILSEAGPTFGRMENFSRRKTQRKPRENKRYGRMIKRVKEAKRSRL